MLGVVFKTTERQQTFCNSPSVFLTCSCSSNFCARNNSRASVSEEISCRMISENNFYQPIDYFLTLTFVHLLEPHSKSDRQITKQTQSTTNALP